MPQAEIVRDADQVSPEELFHPESMRAVGSVGREDDRGVAGEGLWSPARRALTIGLVMTITLVAFEALAVSTIMPIVARELGGVPLYGWVFSAFFLGSLLGIVVAGGAIDRQGLVWPFAFGLGLFGTGLVVGGFAPTMTVLIGARFVQGLGAGTIPPIAFVAIARSLPERLRPQMFATLSTAWVLPGVIGPAIAGLVAQQTTWRAVLPGVIGPAIAGLVAQQTTWRAVLLGLVPLIAVSGGLTFSALGRVGPPAASSNAAAERQGSSRRLRYALVVALGAGAITAGLTNGAALRVAGTSIPQPVVLLLFAGAGLALLVPSFSRLTPPGTLRAARGLPTAILLRGLSTFAFFGVDAYVAFALVEWRGLTAAEAGIALTAATLAWTAGSWVQARGAMRFGQPFFVRAGFAVVIVGLASFGLVLIPAVPVWLAAPTFGLVGFGMGLAYAPVSLIVLREAAPGEQGAATAALSLSDALGTALGTGVAGAILAAGLRSGLVTGAALAPTLAVSLVVALVGLLLSGRLPRSAPRSRPQRAAPQRA